MKERAGCVFRQKDGQLMEDIMRAAVVAFAANGIGAPPQIRVRLPFRAQPALPVPPSPPGMPPVPPAPGPEIPPPRRDPSRPKPSPQPDPPLETDE